MLETLGDLGDFLGGIGVIVTLVYLAIQIRRNTEQTRLNTAGEAWSGIRDAYEPAYHGNNAEIFRLGLSGELDPSDADYMTFSMLMLRIISQFELSLYQARHGTLDDELFAMHARLARMNLTSRGGRTWWDTTGSKFFSETLVTEIESVLESDRKGPPAGSA